MVAFYCPELPEEGPVAMSEEERVRAADGRNAGKGRSAELSRSWISTCSVLRRTPGT